MEGRWLCSQGESLDSEDRTVQAQPSQRWCAQRSAAVHLRHPRNGQEPTQVSLEGGGAVGKGTHTAWEVTGPSGRRPPRSVGQDRLQGVDGPVTEGRRALCWSLGSLRERRLRNRVLCGGQGLWGGVVSRPVGTKLQCYQVSGFEMGTASCLRERHCPVRSRAC